MRMTPEALGQAVPDKRRRNPSPKARWHGTIEGMQHFLVYGWAVDVTQPQMRVVLEVCINDEPIGSTTANVARIDLAQQFSVLFGDLPHDPCHGFVADLGYLSPKIRGKLSVRVANTDAPLQGSFRLDAPPLPPSAATSMVIGDGGLRLHGWAHDPVQPQRTPNVRAYVGDLLVAEALANIEHPAMRSAEVGRHGFILDLPIELADGALHSVRVVDEAGLPLGGSPISVCCTGSGLGTLLGERDPLVKQVVQTYETHLPRSLGLGHYAEWSARFGSASVKPAASSLHLGMIVTGQGDGAALASTLSSLKEQQGIELSVFQAADASAFAAALQAAAQRCDVIGTVRAGDTVHQLALALEGFALDGAQMVYSDAQSGADTKCAPWFKPAWNLDYALASDYPLDLLLVRSALVVAIGKQGWPQDQAELAWQSLAAAQAPGAIVHVPHVLCNVNTPLTTEERQARTEAARRALTRLEPAAQLEELAGATSGQRHAARRIRRPLSDSERATSVSLIIPTRDYADMLARCIDSIERHTDWPNLELIVIDNGSVEAKTRTLFRALAKKGIRVLAMPGAFNFARLNNDAVAQARGEIVGLVNNDIEALHDGWLDELVSQLLRPGVGAVGAKLLWPNGMVQHGGVLLGVGNVAGHFGNRLADADWGDHGRNQLAQQVSAVTAACLLLRKADFEAVGGMDPVAFPVAFNDVDLCLKVRALGKKIVWTPFAKLLHAESVSRGSEDTPQKRARSDREIAQLRERWGPILVRDPSYHPSLNLDPYSHAFGGLALPPRDRSPRRDDFL